VQGYYIGKPAPILQYAMLTGNEIAPETPQQPAADAANPARRAG
jgi:hypothetical protein